MTLFNLRIWGIKFLTGVKNIPGADCVDKLNITVNSTIALTKASVKWPYFEHYLASVKWPYFEHYLLTSFYKYLCYLNFSAVFTLLLIFVQLYFTHLLISVQLYFTLRLISVQLYFTHLLISVQLYFTLRLISV